MITIYLLSNTKSNPRGFYVGRTSRPLEDRISEHQASVETIDNLLYRAMRKYGPENFITTILETFDSDDLDEIDTREQFWIETYSKLGTLYNTILNPKSPTYKISPERAKARAERTRQIIDSDPEKKARDYDRRRQSIKAFYERKKLLSDSPDPTQLQPRSLSERGKKISVTLRNRKPSKPTIETAPIEKRPYRHSDETKEKQRLAKINRTEEQRLEALEKFRSSLQKKKVENPDYLRPTSPEERLRRSESMKAKRALETPEEKQARAAKAWATRRAKLTV